MTEQPKTLDRIHAVELEPRLLETVEEDLKELYECRKRKWEEDRSRFPHKSGQHRFYIELGKALLGFEGIGENVEYFNELESKVISLGRDVAFLVSEYEDRGLATEASCWFGIAVRSGSHTLSFKPVSDLREQWPWNDCSQEELSTLYVRYLEGQADFFTRKYEYGTSLMPNGNAQGE